MCLVSKTAGFYTKRDIICYKVVQYEKGKYISCVKGFKYKLKQAYTATLGVEKKPSYSSWRAKLDSLKFLWKYRHTLHMKLWDALDTLRGHYYVVNEGFHAYRWRNTACELAYSANAYSLLTDAKHTYIILQCLIPKGSFVYMNNSEIVSTDLIIQYREIF